MGVTITDLGSDIQISDGNVLLTVYKSKINVFYDSSNNVTIQFDSRNKYSAAASQFSSPSGTAAQIQAQIADMLYIHT